MPWGCGGAMVVGLGGLTVGLGGGGGTVVVVGLGLTVGLGGGG